MYTEDKVTCNNDRFNSVYNRILDEIENPETIHDKFKHDLAFRLLELMEYLVNDDDTNPLDNWFTE